MFDRFGRCRHFVFGLGSLVGIRVFFGILCQLGLYALGNTENILIPLMRGMRKNNISVSIQAAQIGKQIKDANDCAQQQANLSKNIFELTEKSNREVQIVQSSINMIAGFATDLATGMSTTRADMSKANDNAHQAAEVMQTFNANIVSSCQSVIVNR